MAGRACPGHRGGMGASQGGGDGRCAGSIDEQARATAAEDPFVPALTFDLAPEVALPPGSVLVFTIEQQFADGTHNLGKFRLSLLQAPPEPAK